MPVRAVDVAGVRARNPAMRIGVQSLETGGAGAREGPKEGFLVSPMTIQGSSRGGWMADKSLYGNMKRVIGRSSPRVI